MCVPRSLSSSPLAALSAVGSTRSRAGWATLLALALSAGPALALAQTDDTVREVNELIREGTRAYGRGAYVEAAEALERAHALRPDPRLLYNIARAREQAGQLEEALELYRSYLGAERGTDPTLLKRSALAVDRLRGLIDQRQQERDRLAAERLEAEARAQKAAAQAKAATEEARRQRLTLATRSDEQLRARRLGAYVSGGVALTGLGLGATFGLLALGSKGDFERAETVADKEAHAAATRDRALVADLALGVGIASAVAAVLLHPWAADASEGQTDAGLTVRPSGLGATLEVRF